MSKIKDTGSLAKTIENLTNIKPEIVNENEALNYFMPQMEKLYNLINPSFTTIQSNNLIYFNSTEDNNDNAYPNQLIDYYNNASSTFSNLIDLRRNMLIGNGLQPIKEDQATIDFLNKENQFGESLQEIWSKLGFDYSLFESYSLECLYLPKDGIISEIIHHSPSCVRAVANTNPNLPYTNVWELSRSWGKTNKQGKYTKAATQGLPIANFNPKTWGNDGGRQLLVCKRYTAGNEVYAIPSFNSILPYVELDAQLAKFNLNSVVKGFTPQSIVVLAGNPSKEEKDSFINKFKNRYTGANAEKILFIWSTSEGNKPQVMPFQQSDITPMLTLLDKICTQKIASGMGANAELAGIQTQGNSLQSDMNKLAVAYNFYYTSHILPLQKQMLEGINKIMRVNKLSDLTVVTPPLKLDTTESTAAAVPQSNN